MVQSRAWRERPEMWRLHEFDLAVSLWQRDESQDRKMRHRAATAGLWMCIQPVGRLLSKYYSAIQWYHPVNQSRASPNVCHRKASKTRQFRHVADYSILRDGVW